MGVDFNLHSCYKLRYSLYLMENSRWLTILLIGLVLAGLVVGYFLLRNTFLTNPQPQIQQTTQTVQASPPQQAPSDFVLGQNTNSSPSPLPNTTFNTITQPTPTSAFARLAQRTQAGTTTLPTTGFQLALTGLLSTSAIILGWKLRKYPR